MSAVDCVVFDLDDTLYLERDYVRSGFGAVGDWAREHLGLDDFGERAWRAFERGSRGRVFDEVLVECDVSPGPDLVAALVETYRVHRPHIEMLPDARRALDRLAGGALALGVVTGGPRDSQRAKARALGVDRWSRASIFTAELGAGFDKPHPRAFESLEQQLGCSGSGCVYVADDPARDFAGPRRLGWRTLRVRRAGGLHAAVPSGADVDLEVRDLELIDDHLRLGPG